MAEGDFKEAWFSEYCPICKHAKKDENEEPCAECLGHAGVVDSHKPLKFERIP